MFHWVRRLLSPINLLLLLSLNSCSKFVIFFTLLKLCRVIDHIPCRILAFALLLYDRFDTIIPKLGFACLMLQMLTSKDTNFIGFTFKKSDVLKSLESSGLLQLSFVRFPCIRFYFSFLFEFLINLVYYLKFWLYEWRMLIQLNVNLLKGGILTVHMKGTKF